MVRGAGWDEIVFLLFGDVAFLGFGWMFLASVAMLGRDTPPAPLKRGGWDVVFLFGNEWVECEDSPLERGLRGVLR